MRSQYEQLIEYIINDEQDKAKELFHNLVVAKSRDIYNEIVAEEMEEEVEEAEDMDEEAVEEDSVDENFGMEEAGDDMSMDQTDDMMHDIEADHDGMDGADDDMGMDSDDMDMGDEAGEEGDVEDRVMDLEDALEDLKAEFEKLMAQEKDEPEHAEEGVVREYVEKVGEPYKGEFGAGPNGKPVGAGTGEFVKTGESNPKSVVAGKNDMGGTAKNIAQKSEQVDPNGKQYTGPKSGNFPHSGKFLNAPGGDAGKKGFSNAKKPQSAEGKFATGGGPNVNKKSNLPK
jgi:hypothetical protein